MKNVFLAIAIFSHACCYCQYYYNDMEDAKAISARMKNYIDQKVKTISAAGYDARGAKTPDFNEWQEVNGEKRILRISARNGQQVTRQYYQFDEQYKLTTITDSSAYIKSTTQYNYNARGELSSIKTSAWDSLQDFTETIEHQYHYAAGNKPAKLLRIINNKDTSEYRFTTDAQGNLADEQLYRRGVGIDPIYYYYDERNRLTDIVRYNKKARKLLPTTMFEYDDSDRIIQKMTILSTNNPDYLIWRYIYNDKGLKTKEALFNKQKELTGRIEYSYTFGNQ
jgi:YD repeat-containing protein